MFTAACSDSESGTQISNPGVLPSDSSDAGSAGIDTVTESLINGYRLTGIEFYNVNGALTGNITISYDDAANTDTWTSFAEDGSVSYRDVGVYNDAGRLIKSDSYDAEGSLEFSREYTIERGLITQRAQSTGEVLDFYYTVNSILDKREYRASAESAVNRVIDFAHDNNGQISSAVETTIAADGSQEVFNRVYAYDPKGRLSTEATLFGDVDSGVEWQKELIYDEFDNHIRSNYTNEFGELEQYSIYHYEPSPKPIVNNQLRKNRFFL